MSAKGQFRQFDNLGSLVFRNAMLVDAQKTTKGPTIIVFRDDGVRLRVRAPDRKFTPPHDLIHFLVEKGMGLPRGFWGSIASGAKFSSVEIIEGRQKPKANERSAEIIKANQRQLSEAEAVVGAFQTVLHELNPSEEDLWRRLRTCGRRVEDALVRPTWSQLRSFRREWEQLAMGKVIRLDWKVPFR
jgi:hypothetical protein